MAEGTKLSLAAHREVTERVRNGETLRKVGSQYGITGERVRQVAAAVDPQATAVGQLVRAAIKRERAAALAEVRAVQRALRNGPCRICRGPVTRSIAGLHVEHGKATCSRRCHELWGLARYTLDEDDRQRRRHGHARWALANSTDLVRRRWATRQLAGTARSHGRWHQQGSKAQAAMQEIEERRAEVRASGEEWWT